MATKAAGSVEVFPETIHPTVAHQPEGPPGIASNRLLAPAKPETGAALNLLPKEVIMDPFDGDQAMTRRQLPPTRQ